jgi:hypothetical protein
MEEELPNVDDLEVAAAAATAAMGEDSSSDDESSSEEESMVSTAEDEDMADEYVSQDLYGSESIMVTFTIQGARMHACMRNDKRIDSSPAVRQTFTDTPH